MNVKNMLDTIEGLKKAADTLSNLGGRELAEHCKEAILLIDGKKPIHKLKKQFGNESEYTCVYCCPECMTLVEDEDNYCRHCGQALFAQKMI